MVGHVHEDKIRGQLCRRRIESLLVVRKSVKGAVDHGHCFTVRRCSATPVC